MSRKVAREVAMKIVFSELLSGEDTYEAVLEKSGISQTPSQDDFRFANAVVEGINNHLGSIDNAIQELAIGWSVGRMPRVDLSIMRVAVYELCHSNEVPEEVVINEAVELAKAFGGEKSPAYINGMLGSLSKKLKQKNLEFESI